jgi:hypothetical protein
VPSILSGSRRLTSTILIRLAAVPLVVVVMGSATGSYAVRTVTALVAATVLLRSARHRTDRLVRAPLFFAAALLVGVGSGLASAGYLLVVGHPAQIGWFSD